VRSSDLPPLSIRDEFQSVISGQVAASAFPSFFFADDRSPSYWKSRSSRILVVEVEQRSPSSYPLFPHPHPFCLSSDVFFASHFLLVRILLLIVQQSMYPPVWPSGDPFSLGLSLHWQGPDRCSRSSYPPSLGKGSRRLPFASSVGPFLRLKSFCTLFLTFLSFATLKRERVSCSGRTECPILAFPLPAPQR